MLFRSALLALLLTATVFADDTTAQRWVGTTADGRLAYRHDERGNRIPDFSHCGYAGGGVPLPDVPVRRTLAPQTGDRTQAIQQAINDLAATPADSPGLRGTILLQRGVYDISGTLRIAAGGIVLRGEGQGDDGTVLHATGTTKRSLIVIAGDAKRQADSTDAASITDEYVPVGADTVTVDRPDRFHVGQTVIVHRPSTAEWIRELGMDRIPPRNDGRPISQWTPGNFDLRFDRVITAIDGNRVTFDAPFTNAFERRFGGGTVYPYRFDGRVEHVGVENLRAVSAFAGKTDEDESHAWTAVEIDRAQNVWVRDVTSVHFGFGLADIRRDARWVTVQDSSCLDPVSKITGSRRYSFNIAGQLSLVLRCFSRDARHDFALDSRVPGPNAFVHCTAQGSHSDSGPHHRWSTGTLFDNVAVPDDAINLQNRLNLGSGHGWAGANSVLWNCTVRQYAVQDPPTARNWAIGVVGERVAPLVARNGYEAYAPADYRRDHPAPDPGWRFGPDAAATIQSPGSPVEPASLYLAQLRDRLGDAAVRAIAPPTPQSGATPASDRR